MAYPSLETQIGKILVQNAGLSEKDLEDVLRVQAETSKRIGEILIERNLMRPDDIARALAFQLGLPYIEDLKPNEIDPTIISGLTIQFCRENSLLPILMDEKILRIAVSDPFNYEPLDALRLKYDRELDLVLATKAKLDEAVNRVFERSENMIKGLEEEAEDYAVDLKETADLLEAGEDEAPVIKFVNSLLLRAVKEKASDIHIEPFEKFVTVRFRIDGILNDVYQAPKQLHAAISSRIKVLAELNIAEKRIPQDGRIKITIAGREVDIRLSVVPVQFGERLVMRLLDKSSVVLDLQKLGFSPYYIDTITRLTSSKYGIFLVTGPTGSGKSTTLAACLKIINTPERNIITVEDPVEFALPGIGQIAVNHKVGLNFAAGLRAILRQDPDVVMVGEIRDRETAEIAINASLTGHLVLSTLHTNDAVSGISRLLDMGIEPFLVSSSVRAFQAQRLVRTLCTNCSQPAKVDDSTLLAAGFPLEQKHTLRSPGGCRQCRGTGFLGRLAIMEICQMTPALAQKINDRAPVADMKAQALADGMVPMRQYGFGKAIAGITTLEEVLTVTAASE